MHKFDESFVDILIQFENDRKWMSVQNWMVETPAFIQSNKTLLEAAKVMKELKLDFLPIVDPHHKPYGVVTPKDVMEAFVNGDEGDDLLETFPTLQVAQIEENTLLSDLAPLPTDVFLITDQHGVLTGLITYKEIFSGIAALMESYVKNDKVSDVLDVILEKAYEGVAVVDENGIIIEFNEAYSKFTGVPRTEAIGRHVTDVIENTNLHETVQKGIPERGVLQNIQGQDMVVHRIPIWKNGKVVAAIGMLIFEGVSDIYRIYERLQLQKIMSDTESPPSSQDNLSSFDQIIGSSEAISNLKRKARTAARTQVVVLLNGEHGTGKKAFAESIHHLSPRNAESFISISCKNEEPHIIEDQLLGNPDGEPGILSGDRKGTLYLQDIDFLPIAIQKKLLNVLRKKPVDLPIQLIISSTRNLSELAETNDFSSELYAQLNPLQLIIPPLHERKEDIPFLLSHFMREICFAYKIPEKSFSPSAVTYLMNHRWNGNIEELVVVIEDLVKRVPSEIIEQTDLPQSILNEQSVATLESMREKQDSEEKRIILDLLDQTDGNKSRTAELLGIHRTTLYKKLRKFNILT